MGNNRRYSFYQLFAKGNDDRPGNYRVVIPIIQRDYAQGRDNDKAKEVRHDFLAQLHGYLTAPSGGHDLDFVYGFSSLSTDSSKKKEFVPLDGQQRLTTLFLIHLYLAMRSRGSEESDRFLKMLQIKNGKLIESLFSYRTRSSAVEFCNGLIDPENEFSEIFMDDENGENKNSKERISAYICNSNWFYPDWKQDPTVDGMLTMLDAIDDKFDESDHRFILRRLLSEDDPSVTFIFMDLEDYKLTDDLYIKMNSRGKPLTSFENFKAKYEQYIADREKEISGSLLKLRQEIENLGNHVIKTVKDYFAFNVDTKWSKLFWEYSKEEIKRREAEIRLNPGDADGTAGFDRLLSDTFDLKISRFIKMAFVNQYAISHNSGKISIPGELTGDKPLSFAALTNLDAISAEGIVLLIRLFDLYSSRPKEIMPEWSRIYYHESEVFESMIRGGKEFTVTKRLLQYAYLIFRLNFDDSHVSELVEWMRFLYNLTLDDNSIQDITADTYHRAVGSVNSLMELLKQRGNPSIVDLLTSGDVPEKLEFFPEYQYREEILKSCLLRRDKEKILHCKSDTLLIVPLAEENSWGELILNLENHPYFTGQIGFILRMAGINDYYDTNNNLEWEEEEEKRFKNSVVKYGGMASKIFDGGYSKRILANDAMFERAMLATSPDYYYWNLLNSTNKRAGSNNLIRDYSWKSFLRLTNEGKKVTMMVKDLFDRLDNDKLSESLLAVIRSNQSGPQWRKDIINYDFLMPKCINGFFDKSKDGHRILISSIYFSKNDHEVYSFVLYWEYLGRRGEVNQISDFRLSYGNSNSTEEVPFITFSLDDITVKVKSYVDPENGELKCHYLYMDSHGDAGLEQFLCEKGFCKKNESDTIYRRKEHEWDVKTPVDDYRKFVSGSIAEFITDLSAFVKANNNGQQ